MDCPQKLYVEVTTRCNLSCPMCVKYAPGSDIEEADMEPDVFNRLLPKLSGVQTLILNGIGESLLHPELLNFIRRARQEMGPEAQIGLQSNGFLITEEYAGRMLKAGLSTLCLSLDSLNSDPVLSSGTGHSFRAVEKAVSHLQKARSDYNHDFSLGLEVILATETIAELPSIVEWAAANGVNYILTSHLIHYDQGADNSTLFSPYNKEIRYILRNTIEKAKRLGYDFFDELDRYRKYAGTRTVNEITGLFNELQQELNRNDFRYNFQTLTPGQVFSDETVENLLQQAQALAENGGIDLFVPELFALSERQCRFIEEKAAFVAVNGDVMPCHFLWHSYACRVFREQIAIAARSFGTLHHNTLTEIWKSEQYKNFRKEAGDYDYAPCWNCGQGPCANLVNAHEQYANDCFGSGVPCGHCQWNLGGIRCL